MRAKLRAWPIDQRVPALCTAFSALYLAFSPDNFPGMLARAFLLPWMAVFIVLALVAALRRKWWWFAAAAFSVPLLAARSHGPGSGDAEHAAIPALRLAQMNLLQTNVRHNAVVATALGTGADVIAFDEVDTCWARGLKAGLSGRYPFFRIVPLDDLYGIALFSKRPLDSIRVMDLLGHPAIAAQVRTPAGALRVLALHATSPGSCREFRERGRQLERLEGMAKALGMPAVVVGDFNTVDWDSAFRRLCAAADLHGPAGRPRATWPSLAGTALVPIDHILATPELVIGPARTFFIPGSDHRGLAGRVYFKRP